MALKPSEALASTVDTATPNESEILWADRAEHKIDKFLKVNDSYNVPFQILQDVRPRLNPRCSWGITFLMLKKRYATEGWSIRLINQGRVPTYLQFIPRERTQP